MLDDETIFTLFEMTPDLVCIVNKQGYFKKINPAVGSTLGYSETELLTQSVSQFIYPADKKRTAANRSLLLKGKPLLNFQNRYLTKTGDVIWLEWTSIYLADKELVFAIAKNITIGKASEIELRDTLEVLHQLNIQVKQHNEKHRQQVAGTLHEDMSQIVAAIKTKMEWLTEQNQALTPGNRELLIQTLASSTQLLDKLRHLSYSLSADTLTIHGLDASLEGLCKEFSRLAGVRCDYKSNYRTSQLSNEEALDLYRICQEGLQNVRQHAAASHVTVILRKVKGALLLTISDNGIGFNPSKAMLSGISVMKARAVSVQATLTIESDAKGTTIRLMMKNTALQICSKIKDDARLC